MNDELEDGLEALPESGLAIINRNILRIGRRLEHMEERMATREEVDALTASIDELEQAEGVEEGQINAKLDELRAHQADQPDPALEAQIARLQALKVKVTQIIPDPNDAPAAAPAADTTVADGTAAADISASDPPAGDTSAPADATTPAADATVAAADSPAPAADGTVSDAASAPTDAGDVPTPPAA